MTQNQENRAKFSKKTLQNQEITMKNEKTQNQEVLRYLDTR